VIGPITRFIPALCSCCRGARHLEGVSDSLTDPANLFNNRKEISFVIARAARGCETKVRAEEVDREGLELKRA
jgi:hypothetical protein